METSDFNHEWETFTVFCVKMYEQSLEKLSIGQRQQLMRDFEIMTFVRKTDSDAISFAAVQFVFNNENLMKVVKDELNKRLKHVPTKKSDRDQQPAPSRVQTKLEPYLKIESSLQKGRHIILTNKIGPNKKILSRKPLESWLKTSLLTSNCYCCFRALKTNSSDSEPTRCLSCQLVNYCSSECDKEMSTKHSIECPAMNVLKDMSFGQLALRLALHGSDIARETKKCNREPITDYDEILKCVDHVEKYEPKVLLADSLGAVFLTLLAISTQVITSGVEELFAGRILKHIYQIAVNGIQVLDKNDANKTQTLGVGMYVHVTLLNHACYSQLNTQFIGNEIVLSSRDRELKVGQELSLNYGQNYKVITNRQMRCDILRNFYFFDCDCFICHNNIKDIDI